MNKKGFKQKNQKIKEMSKQKYKKKWIKKLDA